MEFALTLPAVALVLVLLLHAGGAAADLLRVQHLARDAARAAVLDQPAPRVAGGSVRIVGPSRSGAVTATATLRSRWLSRYGPEVVFTARAVMVDEP